MIRFSYFCNERQVNNKLHQREWFMSTIKEQMFEVINSQPLDASYDEILTELAFQRMVDRGLNDSHQQRIYTNEEIEQRIQSWQS
jgi:hypothetical protein